MTYISRRVRIFALFFLSGATCLFRETALVAASEETQPIMEVRPPRMGGYKTVEGDDGRLAAAAKFAMISEYASKPAEVQHLGGAGDGIDADGRSRFDYRVMRASRQVVAGMNYRMRLELLLDGKCVEVHDVTVYDRFGELSVTSRTKSQSCSSTESTTV
mmetsp:Transcript_36572/g.85497  ORF Transcript_36572/g.85497 Transcript_36572/m.85497 type:complete len:160 (-) Transcript_36572:233-712(-)